jgi:hypothetical protein
MKIGGKLRGAGMGNASCCETRKTPIKLCLDLDFLVFLHMFCGLAWFCIKPRSMVLDVFLILQKNLTV